MPNSTTSQKSAPSPNWYFEARIAVEIGADAEIGGLPERGEAGEAEQDVEAHHQDREGERPRHQQDHEGIGMRHDRGERAERQQRPPES